MAGGGYALVGRVLDCGDEGEMKGTWKYVLLSPSPQKPAPHRSMPQLLDEPLQRLAHLPAMRLKGAGLSAM